MMDPEHARFRRNYPRFPGVPETIRLLKLRGTGGAYLDAILWEFRDHASSVLDEAMDAVREEDDERVRYLLVGELAETGDHRLLDFFVELLDDPHESVAHWAQVGLEHIDTKDARRALYEHRFPRH
jgi:hypothetical protein